MNENNINSWIDLITTISIAIITVIFTSRFTLKPEKQSTDRMMFDRNKKKIFSKVEPFIFSKNISLEQVTDLGNQILLICHDSDGYYHPSIKGYAERLIDSTESNYLENWGYFSERFSMRYDKVCLSIGVPTRNSAYRLNHKQYNTKSKMFWMIFKNEWPSFLFILITLYLIYFLIKI